MTDKMRSTVLVILSTFLLLTSFALASDEDKVLSLWETPVLLALLGPSLRRLCPL